MHALVPLAASRAQPIAEALAAMIDGVYIREALASGAPDGMAAADFVIGFLDRELGAAP